jgi:hypothetical protein
MSVRELENKYSPQIYRIINRIVYKFTELFPSTEYQDTKECFDVVYKCNEIRIPVRIRKHQYISFSDFTVRSRSYQNNRTEYHKLKDGFGDYYVYCWENASRSKIHSYMIIDLHSFRKSGTINKPENSGKNTDGTEFMSWSLTTLAKSNSLMMYEVLV